MALYRLRSGGSVVRTDTLKEIPQDLENADWQDYLVWAASNTPDPAPSEALDAARYRTKAAVDAQAEVEYGRAFAGRNPLTMMVEAMAVAEARIAVNDVSTSAANYPILQGIVDAGAAIDLDAAATAVAASIDAGSVSNQLGKVRAARDAAHVDIDDAVSVAACDGVVSGLSWPTPL